jgi:hypothetical protein
VSILSGDHVEGRAPRLDKDSWPLAAALCNSALTLAKASSIGLRSSK